jgi:hypothetical protein
MFLFYLNIPFILVLSNVQVNYSFQNFIMIQIQTNQPTKCNNFLSLLLDVYVQLNMFRASSRPSSAAQQLQ